MPGNCSFQEQWLTDPDFQYWIKQNKYETFCKLCKCKINIKHDGNHALTSHRRGKKHSDFETPIQKKLQSTLQFSVKLVYEELNKIRSVAVISTSVIHIKFKYY